MGVGVGDEGRAAPAALQMLAVPPLSMQQGPQQRAATLGSQACLTPTRLTFSCKPNTPTLSRPHTSKSATSSSPCQKSPTLASRKRLRATASQRRPMSHTAPALP